MGGGGDPTGALRSGGRPVRTAHSQLHRPPALPQAVPASPRPMFDDFPKTRPVLPEGIRRIYVTHYKENRSGQSPASFLSQKLEGWLHRQVAKDLQPGGGAKTTLEIGAGTLNQLEHEPEVGPY